MDLEDPDCVDASDNLEDGGFGGATTCNDGIDNDADGLIDAADFGCESASDADEADPMTECNDGLDNDGDGWSDLDDPGCPTPLTELETGGYNSAYDCNDSVDNDGTGGADSHDPQCTDGYDNSESR